MVVDLISTCTHIKKFKWIELGNSVVSDFLVKNDQVLAQFLPRAFQIKFHNCINHRALKPGLSGSGWPILNVKHC